MIEQKDYLLREIEKIGAIIISIRQKLFGGKGKTAISLDSQIESAKTMLLNEANFDLDRFLALNQEDSRIYIDSFKGFSVENIELLAECIYQMVSRESSTHSKKYLEKSLQLYELCNLKSKTYSITREAHIKEIKKRFFIPGRLKP